jgi:hypothetical protein
MRPPSPRMTPVFADFRPPYSSASISVICGCYVQLHASGHGGISGVGLTDFPNDRYNSLRLGGKFVVEVVADGQDFIWQWL